MSEHQYPGKSWSTNLDLIYYHANLELIHYHIETLKQRNYELGSKVMGLELRLPDREKLNQLDDLSLKIDAICRWLRIELEKQPKQSTEEYYMVKKF